jgi:hypothetical protein
MDDTVILHEAEEGGYWVEVLLFQVAIPKVSRWTKR